MPVDVDTLLIKDRLVTRGNIHDSSVSHDSVDSVVNLAYILADSGYDTSEIFDYTFENSHSIPVIDIKGGRGIVPQRRSVNRRIGTDLKKEYSSLDSFRFDI